MAKTKKKTEVQRIKTFAEACAAKGKNEQDYISPSSATNKEKAGICLDKLKLIASVLNGDKKPNMADTSQGKYYPLHEIIEDTSRPSGFRLVYLDCAYGGDYANLGARPYTLTSDDAIYIGKQFIPEYEEWIHYENLATQEI